MLSSPATVARRSNCLYHFIRSSGKPPSPVKITPPAAIAVKPLCRSTHFRSFHHPTSSISLPIGGVKELRSCFKNSIDKLGSDLFRMSAVSNGGGSSGGSSSGGSGSGGSGDQSGGFGGGNPIDGGNNWSLLSWYLSLLEKYPVLTKAITSALLTLVGDVICQIVIDKAPSIDWKRTLLFTSLGLVLVGPTLHFWYLSLSKMVTLSGSSGALARLILDQFIFSPLFIGVFLSTLVTLEGKPQQVIPKLQQEWFSAVLANWQLWIPFQFLNFRFVPQQFQVLAANFIALIWNVILSYKAHKEIIVK